MNSISNAGDKQSNICDKKKTEISTFMMIFLHSLGSCIIIGFIINASSTF